MSDLSKDLDHVENTEVKLEIPSFTKAVDLPNVKTSSDTTVTITKAATFKFRSKSKKSDYHPNEQELADLNGTYSLVDWNPEDIYVFTMLAADLEEDRQNEQFLPPALYDAAKVLKGKTWLYDPHEWKTSNEVGRIMDTWVENDSQLMLKVYILNTPDNQKFLNNVFAGIHSGISIGFTSKFEDMLCMSCAKVGKTVSIYDKNNCYHQPGAYDEFGGTTKVAIAGVLDGFEVSNAPVPAQKPASILAKSMGAADVQDAIDAIAQMEKAAANITIANESIVDGSWGDVNKTTLGQELADAGDAGAINEAYLFVGDIKERSTWKFPHHVLTGTTLKVHRGGVHAAAQRLVSTGATETDVPKKAAARHLLKHYRAMKEDAPESLMTLSKFVSTEEVETELAILKTLQLQDENLEWVKEEMKELEEMKAADLMPECAVPEDEMLMEEACTKAEEPTIEDNSVSADTIKSESSIIQDNKDMSVDETKAQDEVTPQAPETVDFKSVLDGLNSLNENLETLKGSMTELLTVVTESKDMLSRFSTPKDGEDADWAMRTVKQEEQAQILENLVEKTVKVLETLTNDGSKEPKPFKNEWAQKLAKKLVSGGNN